MSASHSIRQEIIKAGELTFQMQTCGDRGADRLALCLHGFPEHGYSWRHQLRHLADLGYRVWAPNQRGYSGTTPRPSRRADYAMEHLLRDTASLIDASGARSITLIGHDWGGLVAWVFALRKVRALERLVILNAPHPERFDHHLRHDPEQRRRVRFERFFQLPWLPERLLRSRRATAVGAMFTDQAVHAERFPNAVLDVYRRQALEPGALGAMLDWYRANPFRRVARERGPRIEVPTLMIWGEYDRALRKELTYGTEQLVRDFSIRYVRASHWVQQDAPDEVNTILASWLQTERPA